MKNIIFLFTFINIVAADKVIVLQPDAPQADKSLVKPHLTTHQLSKAEFNALVMLQMQQKDIPADEAIISVQGAKLQNVYIDNPFNRAVTTKTMRKMDAAQAKAAKEGLQRFALVYLRGGADGLAIPTSHTTGVQPTVLHPSCNSKTIKVNPAGPPVVIDIMDDMVDTGETTTVVINHQLQHICQSGASHLAKSAYFRFFLNYGKEGKASAGFDTFWFPELLYAAYKAKCEAAGTTPLPFNTLNPELQKELDSINPKEAYIQVPNAMVRIYMFFMQEFLVKLHLEKNPSSPKTKANIRQFSAEELKQAQDYAEDIMHRVEMHTTVSSHTLKRLTGTPSPWIETPNEVSAPHAKIANTECLSNALQAALSPAEIHDLNLILPTFDQSINGQKFTNHDYVDMFMGISNQLSDIFGILHTHTTIEVSDDPKILSQDILDKSCPGKIALLVGGKNPELYPKAFMDFVCAHHDKVVVLNLNNFEKEGAFYSHHPMAQDPSIKVIHARIQESDGETFSIQNIDGFYSQLQPFMDKAGQDIPTHQ